MAFLPGIFNQPQQTPPPATPPANANGSAGPAGQQQGGPANPAANPANMGGQPATPNAGGPEGGAASPLDAFTDFFKPKQVDPNAPKAPTLADPYLGSLDPTKFKEQVNQANFAANIPAETIQKAITGDAQAFADAINMAAREAFAASAQLSHGLVEQGVRAGADRVSGSMDSRFRNFQIKGQNTSNEALNHPAVAPMLNAVKMQIASSNPNLSAADVQAQAEQYFTQMANVLAPNKQDSQAGSGAQKSGTDFSSYLQ